MGPKQRDGAAILPPSQEDYLGRGNSRTSGFDWVNYQCPCPNCGAEIRDFQTTDLCRQLDRADYRTVYHFYGQCTCGTWIDFIRKPAEGIEDFERHVEQL